MNSLKKLKYYLLDVYCLLTMDLDYTYTSLSLRNTLELPSGSLLDYRLTDLGFFMEIVTNRFINELQTK
jgi:hypothetical protein